MGENIQSLNKNFTKISFLQVLLYSFPKMHKVTVTDLFLKLRPTLISVGICNYSIVKYILLFFSCYISYQTIGCKIETFQKRFVWYAVNCLTNSANIFENWRDFFDQVSFFTSVFQNMH